MSENKYYLLDFIFDKMLSVYISYLDKEQMKYIEDILHIDIENEDYDAILEEGIVYPFEAYDICLIEKYNVLIKYLNDNGYIQKGNKYTIDELIVKLKEREEE